MLVTAKRLSYSFLDALTRRWGLPTTINGMRWRLAGLCWRAFPRSWEAEVARFFDSVVEPGMVVADVGAHVGIHTLGLAQRVGAQGHVYAFEPVPDAAALLARHLKLNGLENRVTIVRRAVGDVEGHAEMLVDPAGPDPGNSFVARSYAPRIQRLTVAVATLGGFFEGCNLRPRVIKIDVEGYELRVLRGATGLLRGVEAPTLVCALHPWHLRQLGESEEAFFSEAEKLGLDVLTLQGIPTRPEGTYREVVLRRRSPNMDG